jgi:hypothetical protein
VLHRAAFRSPLEFASDISYIRLDATRTSNAKAPSSASFAKRGP